VTAKVDRSEILDFETYRERRKGIQKEIFEIKRRRRIHLGEYLTFLFENTDTIRYQIQEMMLAERIVKETAIQHEMDTYNGLLGGSGELGCALLIGIEDKEQRPRLLSQWLELPKQIYVRLQDGSKVYATYDPMQVGEDRVSAVQYLKFNTGGQVPVAVGTDHPNLRAEAELTEEQRKALEEDLRH
jgi:hypothetical protein